MSPLIVALISLVVGLAIGWALGFLRSSKKAEPLVAEANLLRAERDRLGENLASVSTANRELSERAARAEGLLEAKNKEHAKAEGAILELNSQMQELRRQLSHESVSAERARSSLSSKDESLQKSLLDIELKDSALNALQAETKDLKAQLADTKAHLVHSERANHDIKGFLEEAQVKLSGTFAELAGNVFGQKSEIFEKNVKDAGEKSKSDIGLLLNPFQQRITEFQRRLESLYGDEARERASLQGAVNELKTLNQDMAEKAAALTRALTGNAKIRGDWGEMMLESVLGACGLEEGRHYDRQKSVTDEDMQKHRPDIVVRLPDDRRVVVDSKVSLLAWIEATNADTPEDHKAALRNHAVSVRQHIKDLGEKNYPKVIGPAALEYTVAFVPIEGALSAALDIDSGLQGFAFERRVVLASPNTLMALLSVVERLWTRDRIQRRADEVSQLGGRLVDALVKFLEDFDKIGGRLIGAHEAFNDAKRSLSESNQAVLPRARRLVELGIRGKRVLPEELQPDLIEQVENERSELSQDVQPARPSDDEVAIKSDSS
jgi:DNA recombination protein RmuC